MTYAFLLATSSTLFALRVGTLSAIVEVVPCMGSSRGVGSLSRVPFLLRPPRIVEFYLGIIRT